jgi:hypothetical protein
LRRCGRGRLVVGAADIGTDTADQGHCDPDARTEVRMRLSPYGPSRMR